MTNNGEIANFPHFVKPYSFKHVVSDEQFDAFLTKNFPDRYFEAPTAVGHCMYIRRACLDEVGELDVENFGLGYGEENDFSLRAAANGWRNVIAAICLCAIWVVSPSVRRRLSAFAMLSTK